MTRIHATATADLIDRGLWAVSVWGGPNSLARGPEDARYVRSYDIKAKSDTLAAQDGISRFVDEIENLLGAH